MEVPLSILRSTKVFDIGLVIFFGGSQKDDDMNHYKIINILSIDDSKSKRFKNYY